MTFYANGVADRHRYDQSVQRGLERAAGAYTLTAIATDNVGGTGTSPVVNVTVSPIPGRFNVAAGPTAARRRRRPRYGVNYPASGAINGDHKGLLWGAGGAWSDGTQNASPDWLEVRFPGLKLIEEVSVYSMQDNYTAPIEPTPTMTFGYFGLRAFEIQYWDGAQLAAGAWRRGGEQQPGVAQVRVHAAHHDQDSCLHHGGAARLRPHDGSRSVRRPSGRQHSAGHRAHESGRGRTVYRAGRHHGQRERERQRRDHRIVEFFADGVSIGTDTTSPYSLTWSNVAQGTYTVTAKATDDQGGTTTSTAVPCQWRRRMRRRPWPSRVRRMARRSRRQRRSP